MSYDKLAPTVQSSGLAASEVYSKFPKEKIEKPSKATEAPTKEQIESILTALYVDGIEAHNGHVALAQELSLSMATVKQIIEELEAYRSYRESL